MDDLREALFSPIGLTSLKLRAISWWKLVDGELWSNRIWVLMREWVLLLLVNGLLFEFWKISMSNEGSRS
ncbi:hypothetical protein Ahy_B05g078000 isoform B [Arachis hypogaea]|uniref:Reverse transcriptase zinc-binding domain-containing protein n=1 Tax=Arachis hypogaea TaxID=3818 RepID=A0A444Z628_ARAHY|nr:hypothetical protein Ahy_B05g078000 isoform B [Arachis hypogaea]